jgi:hypothetical protein
MAEALLKDYSFEALMPVLELEALTATELRGVARLLAGWDFWKGRAQSKSRIASDVRRRLRAEVERSGLVDNLARFDRAWR